MALVRDEQMVESVQGSGKVSVGMCDRPKNVVTSIALSLVVLVISGYATVLVGSTVDDLLDRDGTEQIGGDQVAILEARIAALEDELDKVRGMPVLLLPRRLTIQWNGQRLDVRQTGNGRPSERGLIR